MRAHLATCSDAHAEIAELGGVLPVLDASVPVVEPPAGLEGTDHGGRGRGPGGTRGRAEGRSARGRGGRRDRRPRRSRRSPVAPRPPQPPERPLRRRSRAPTNEPPAARGASTGTWVLRIAAVLAIVLLGGWNLLLQGQLNTANAYEQSVAAVLDVAAQPGSHDRDPDRGRRQRRVRPGRDQRVGRRQHRDAGPRRDERQHRLHRMGDRGRRRAGRARRLHGRQQRHGIARGDRCPDARPASSWR